MRYDLLERMIERLHDINFDPEILLDIQWKLHMLLHLGGIEIPNKSTSIKMASCHQNIIGWRNLLGGFISDKWSEAQHRYLRDASMHSNKQWSQELVKAALDLYLGMPRQK
jgi:hypothetical protein